MELYDLNQQEAAELAAELLKYKNNFTEDMRHSKEYMKGKQVLIEKYLQAAKVRRFESLANDPEALLKNIADRAPVILKNELATRRELADTMLPYAQKLTADDEKIDIDEFTGCETFNGVRYLKKDEAAEILYDIFDLHIAELEKHPNQKQSLETLFLSILNNAEEIHGPVKELPNIPKRPRLPIQSKYIINNDPVTFKMLNRAIKENVPGQWSLRTGPGETGGFLSLDYSGIDLVTFRHKKYALTLKEQFYFDIVCTMWADWQTVYKGQPFIFSPVEVWRRSRNFDIKDHNHNPKPGQLDDIIAFLEKFSRLYIFINIDAEINSGMLDPVFLEKAGYRVENGNVILPNISSEVGIPMLDTLPQRYINTENHTIVQKGYVLRTPPLLLLYNLGKDAVLYQRNEFLKMPENKRLRDERGDFIQTAGYYIATQLKIYERQGTRSNYNKIMLEKLYEVTKTLDPRERLTASYTGDIKSAAFNERVKEERKADRAAIKSLLDNWQKQGLIKGYEEITNGHGGVEGWKIKPVMGK